MTPVTPEACRCSFRRLLAHYVDAAICLLLVVPPLLAFSLVDEGSALATVIAVVFLFGLLLGPVVYFVLTQRRTGRSPGKRLLGIRVVDAMGDVPSTKALWKRSITLVFEYFLVLAFIAMMASPYRQRFADLWAGTYVIRDR